MRCTRFAASVAFTLGLLPGVMTAASLKIDDQTPQSYDDVETVVDTKIPQNLEELQCGGWKVETVNGKISQVSGVPGRVTQWNGSIVSGMGTRIDTNGNGDKNDDYIFPDSTTGLTVSCWDNLDRVTKRVWRYAGSHPNEVQQVDETYPHPYFTDPACRWRLEKEDGSFSDQAPSIPLKQISEYPSPPKYGQLKDEPVDRQSPPNCVNFCKYVNTYQFITCRNVGAAIDPLTLVPYFTCAPEDMVPHFLCSEQPVEGNAETCMPGQPATQWPNARTCKGAECRCSGIGCINNPIGDPYLSYYRQYQGAYARMPLTGIDGLNDKNSNAAQVACYGFYNEFDPFKKQTRPEDRRCVINIDVSTYKESQKGKGQYGQNSSLPDRDPNEDANQRNNGAFDDAADLWYQKFTGGFSLLNEKVFDETYDKDLTNVFLNLDKLDKASMRATEQITAAKPLAISNTIRAFDDTGTGRIVVTWWQKQQNEMAAMLHPSVVRILLPAGWAFGADPDDPFFKRVKREEKDVFDSRSERIELQITAEEDILGSALGYIERSLLLNVEEEPVTVVLPVGSPTEFRALAEQWCMWYIREFNKKDCTDAPTDVKNLMDRLEEYADRADDVRALRGELARYAGKIIELQLAITQPISTWVKSNIDKYRNLLEEQRVIRERFSGPWRETEEIFNKFHDETNLPWCMNQRYTSPIYSLLDEWLLSRNIGGRISADFLPKITAKPQEDLTIDFSTIAYMTGSVVLPVLKPVQIRIGDLPTPPDRGQEHGITRSYPPLPSIQNIRTYIQQAADNLPQPPSNVEQPPTIKIDNLGDAGIQQLAGQIALIRLTVEDMNDRYDKFWKSIGPLKPGEPDGGRSGIKQMKENLECSEWNSDTCQHVEMDLMERFVRIGSRPLVMLNEDYESRNYVRSFGGVCLPADDVCTPTHPETAVPRMQWDIYGPQTEVEFMDQLRNNIRTETLPQPVGGLSSSAFPTYDTDPRHLLPAHDVPDAIDLTPPSSSSSSSSSL